MDEGFLALISPSSMGSYTSACDARDFYEEKRRG